MQVPPGEIEVDVTLYDIHLTLHGIYEKGYPPTLTDPGCEPEFIMSAAYHKGEDIINLLAPAVRSSVEGEAVKKFED